jgi:hypothetical protein
MKNTSTAEHAVRLYDVVHGKYRGQYMESVGTCPTPYFLTLYAIDFPFHLDPLKYGYLSRS